MSLTDMICAHPADTLLALLSLCLVSFVPIYCGWRVLDQRPEKKPLATTMQDSVFGAITLALGSLYLALIAYAGGNAVQDFLLSGSGGNFLSNCLGIIVVGLFEMPLVAGAAAIAMGITCCGAKLCTTWSVAPKTWVRWKVLSDLDPRQSFMGGCSLLAGVLGFICVYVAFIASTTLH